MEDMVQLMGRGITQQGVFVSRSRAQQQTKDTERQLREARKLALIVDLDQTLVHTVTDPTIETWVENGTPEIFTIRCPDHPARYFTKVRPYAREFLQSINKLYEMHVFTLGTRLYALEIIKILDPTGEYFSNRILSKDEAFDKKSKTANLAALFPGEDRMVAIIDDYQHVWNFCENLVPVVPYIYFRGSEEVNALSKRDNSAEMAQFITNCEVRVNVASRMNLPAELHALLAAAYPPALAAALGDAVLARVQTAYECDEPDLLRGTQHIFQQLGLTADNEVARWVAAISKEHVDTCTQWDQVKPPVGEGRSAAIDIGRAVDFVSAIFFNADVSVHVEEPRGPRTGARGTGGSAARGAASAAGASHFKQPSLPHAAHNAQPQRLTVTLRLSPGACEEVPPAVRLFLLNSIECARAVAGPDGTTITATIGPCLGAHTTIVSQANIAALKALAASGRLREATLCVRVLSELHPAHVWAEGKLAADIITSLMAAQRCYLRRPRQRAHEDRDDWLRPLVGILIAAHEQFYASGPSANIKTVLRSMVPRYPAYPPWCLHGLTILFSGVIPHGMPLHLAPLALAARSHGAACVSELSPAVTHVVASGTTDKAAAAYRMGKMVVTIDWLNRCFQTRARVLEADFFVRFEPRQVRGPGEGGKRKRHERIEARPATLPGPSAVLDPRTAVAAASQADDSSEGEADEGARYTKMHVGLDTAMIREIEAVLAAELSDESESSDASESEQHVDGSESETETKAKGTKASVRKLLRDPNRMEDDEDDDGADDQVNSSEWREPRRPHEAHREEKEDFFDDVGAASDDDVEDGGGGGGGESDNGFRDHDFGEEEY
jgi:FCP1-like phosphatase family protein